MFNLTVANQQLLRSFQHIRSIRVSITDKQSLIIIIFWLLIIGDCSDILYGSCDLLLNL